MNNKVIFEHGYKHIKDGSFVTVEKYSERIFKVIKSLWIEKFLVKNYYKEDKNRQYIVWDNGRNKAIQKHYQEDGYITETIEDYIQYYLLDIILEEKLEVVVYPGNLNKITTKLTIEESKLVLEYKKNQILIAGNEINEKIAERLKYIK